MCTLLLHLGSFITIWGFRRGGVIVRRYRLAYLIQKIWFAAVILRLMLPPAAA
jgi:hypothetical protein